MLNPFCDKYFSKSKKVAEKVGLNPIVKYRIFGRFGGIAALEPMAELILSQAKEVKVDILKTGTSFRPKDTIATIEGRFQDLVELETQYLQWAALPCYCADKARKISEVAKDKIVSDFAARHLFDPTSVALASYGAMIGGIPSASTDVGANALTYLKAMLPVYKKQFDMNFDKPGIGTTPHALLAIFNGDYEAMSNAYLKAFPNDHFIALIDYNNKEIDDTLKVLRLHGKKLAGVRTDTCGENYAQISSDKFEYAGERGVTPEGIIALKNALLKNGGEHVKVFISSGFDDIKTAQFMESCPSAFDGIGTGSFIPKVPTVTSDIYSVDGKFETKKGREWGLEANRVFYSKEVTAFTK